VHADADETDQGEHRQQEESHQAAEHLVPLKKVGHAPMVEPSRTVMQATGGWSGNF
jgi:hypothetical protein